MRISYLSICHHYNIHFWSGTYYYLSKTLEGLGHNIEYISNLYPSHPFNEKLKIRFHKYFKKDTYEPLFSRSVAEGIARKVSKQLANSNSDILFSPSSIPMAFLETKKPKIFYTDSSLAGVLDYYREFSNFSPSTIHEGHLIEKSALDSCKYAVYSSDWAAQTAIKHYQINPDKVKVIPFGANMDEVRSFDQLEADFKQRDKDVCKLLFVGVDWVRKGGDIALEVTKQLNSAGLPTELWIVGCNPITNEPLPSYVKPYGFLSKRTPEGRRFIEKLYREASFLIVPSRAESYGLVFCEANAFGLPAIATNAGGIPTIIKDDINGMKFDMDASIEKYVQYIYATFSNYERYKELAYSSYNEYSQRLNWRVAGKKLNELFKSAL